MFSIPTYLPVVLLMVVGTVLFMGISVMVGGTKDEARESDRLMAWRVAWQALAVLVLIVTATHTS